MKYAIRKTFLILLVGFLVFSLSGCSSSNDVNTESSNLNSNDETLTIVGLNNEVVEIPVSEVKEYPSVTRNMESITSSGEVKNAEVTGVLLDELLNKNNISLEDAGGLRFIAGDGYSIEVPKEIFRDNDIVIAYEYNGEPLDEKSKPFIVTIDKVRSMYWVRNLVKVELLKDSGEVSISSIVFIEGAITKLPQEDYTYYESVDKAVKVEDLLNEVNLEKANGVFIKAKDGLEKNEDLEVFNKGYIKVTGKDNPVFLSPDLPKGMHVKGILYFNVADKSFFSYESGKEYFDVVESGGTSGISLKDIIKEIGLKDALKYKITAVDGYEVEISVSDIDKGIVYERDEGELGVVFDGLPKNTTVKGLLSIEAINN